MNVRETLDNLPGRPLAEYQKHDVEQIVKNDGQVLYAGCLGSRKTGTGVATMAVYRGVWLVVAPLHTIEQWKETIAEFAPDAEVHVVNTKNKTGLIDLKEARDGFSIHLVGWEYMRRQDWRMFKGITGAIMDEVHRMAGHGTATAKAVWRLNTQFRIGLSGTPARNKMHGLYNVLRWIWYGNKDHRNANVFERFALYMGKPGVDDFRSWLRRHFILTINPYFSGFGEDYIIGPEKQPGSVISEVPCYIQHLEEERCCEWHPNGVNATLPPVEEPIEIYVDMAPSQKKVYDQINSDAAAFWVEDVNGVRTPSVIANKMVKNVRLRQVALAQPTISADGTITMLPDAKSSKLDMLSDLLPDIVEPGDPVLVFTHSKIAAHAATERVNKLPGIRAEAWTGDLKTAERNDLKARFGTDDGPNVIIATIRSIAEGTDGLQHKARREVWLSWEEDDVFNVQAIGRLRRTGQTRRNQTWQIITRGTIEEEVIARKRQERAELRDGLKAQA